MNGRVQLLACLTAETDSLVSLDSSPAYFCHATQSPAATQDECASSFPEDCCPRRDTDKQGIYAGVGTGHSVTATQTLWCTACILTIARPLHTYQPEPGCHALRTLLHHGRGPIHPPAGCQTHHGRRPQRGALIQRKKPLREL